MPVDVDVIILSYAKDDNLKALTEQTIQTLIESEDPELIKFNILVIESNRGLKPYQFAHTTTIYPSEKFGFNKYLNIGIKQTHNPYIALCNNDLVFHKGWASEIFNLMENNPDVMSAAPFCPVSHIRDGYPFEDAYLPTYHLFSGWCFLIKRSLIDIIGTFDENYVFWYADGDYLNTLKKHNIKNYMVTNSKVTHIGSQVSITMPPKTYKEITALPNAYHNYKWRHKNYLYYLIQKSYLYLSIKFFNK